MSRRLSSGPIVTAAKVVDASALAAILFQESQSAIIAERLEGAHLTAPFLLGHELANVCLIKCRRYPEQRETLVQGFRLLEGFDVEEVATDHDAVLRLALATGLTAYDASYLWLSRHLGAELVTLDRQLMAEAARSS